jgi:hypothetical protein
MKVHDCPPWAVGTAPRLDYRDTVPRGDFHYLAFWGNCFHRKGFNPLVRIGSVYSRVALPPPYDLNPRRFGVQIRAPGLLYEQLSVV